MRRSRLGRSGLYLSPLTLGTAGWGDQVDDDEARRITEAYLSAGGASFSAAHAYGGGEAEQMLGRLLDDPDLVADYRTKAVKRARDYSWDAVTDQYEQLLRAACAAGHPGPLPPELVAT